MTVHDDLFPSEIFICYSHQDRGLVDDLMANLKDGNLKALTFWFDRSIDRGAKWKDEIDTHLLSAFVILVIATPHSNASTWCTYEWARALGMGKTVIPLIYSTEHLHEKLAEINGFDFNQGQHPYPEIKQRLLQLYQAQRLNPILRMFNELLNGRDKLPSPADFLNVAFELGLVTDRQFQEANRWLRNLIGQQMKDAALGGQVVSGRTADGHAGQSLPTGDGKKTPATSGSKASATNVSKPPAPSKSPSTAADKALPVSAEIIPSPAPGGSKPPPTSAPKPSETTAKPDPPGKIT